MEFIKGRNNLACTIFIPVNCKNNCRFCTSKKTYNGFEFRAEYLNKILTNILLMNESKFVSEFVITGGEPIADIDILKVIVDACDKPVFINTSLPKQDNIDDVINYFNTEDKIKGINISRHWGITFDSPVCSIDTINKIEKPVRINSIIPTDFDYDILEKMIDTYCTAYRMLNLRADYRFINDSNLKTRDEIFNKLLAKYRFEGSNNCMVCNSCFFSTDDEKVICYHRGVELSSIEAGDRVYVNDIIIDQFGNIYYDWDHKTSDDFIDQVVNVYF